MPVATGEGQLSRFEFRPLLERNGARIIQPDVVKCGGITEFRKIASLAEAYPLALASDPVSAFGGIIALVTCYHGLAQPLRLEEISRATVAAVAQSVVACVLLDALFIILYLAT